MGEYILLPRKVHEECAWAGASRSIRTSSLLEKTVLMHVMNNARACLQQTGSVSSEVGMYGDLLVNKGGGPVSRDLSINGDRKRHTQKSTVLGSKSA